MREKIPQHWLQCRRHRKRGYGILGLGLANFPRLVISRFVGPDCFAIKVKVAYR